MSSAHTLDDVRVASPCKASWDNMIGTDQVRFCRHCQKNVYNLSALSREAAEELVMRKEGRMCVRFYRRADGTMLTDDCPVGLRAIRWAAGRSWAILGGGLLCVLALFIGGASFSAGNRKGPQSLRQLEPFATIMDWFDPPQSPPAVIVPTVVVPEGALIHLGEFRPRNQRPVTAPRR